MVRCPWFFLANGHNFITMMTHLVWFPSTWVLCVWILETSMRTCRYHLLFAHQISVALWFIGFSPWVKILGFAGRNSVKMWCLLMVNEGVINTRFKQVGRSGGYWFKTCVWGIVAGNRLRCCLKVNQVQHDIYDIDLRRLHTCFSWIEMLLWQIEVVHGNLSKGILYGFFSKPLGFLWF